MKKIIFVIVLFLVNVGFINAQDESMANQDSAVQTKVDKHKLKKERNRETAVENLNRLDSLIKSKNWVIEANTIYNRYNMGYPVNSTLNFVSLKDSVLTVQFASDESMGANGLGGITFEGKLMRYDITKNKNIFIHCTALTSLIGSSDIFLNVYSNGRSSAKISDNWGNRYTFDGYIVPYNRSRVYKGMTSY